MSTPLSTYVNKSMSAKNGLSEIMERRQSEKVIEFENIKLDAMIAEEKRKLEANSPPKIDSSQATGVASMLFAGKSPAEIKQILSSLTQEEIDKFTLIAANMNQSNLSNLRGLMQPANSSLGVKDIIEIIKLTSTLQQPQNQNGNSAGEMAKALIDAMKTGMEMAKIQQPTNPQPTQSPMEIYKMVSEIVKPFQDSASAKEKEIMEIRLKEIESKNVNPVEYIKNIKTMASELGIGGNSSGRTELDLKLAEMNQTEKLENKKLDWEMAKWEKEKEADMQKYDMVQKILEGPVGSVLQTLGKAGSDRLKGNPTPTANKAPTSSVQFAQTVCPNGECQKVIYVDPVADKVTCPYCQAELQKASAPPPTPTVTSPPTTPPQSAPTENSAPIAPTENKQPPVDVTVDAPQNATKQ